MSSGDKKRKREDAAVEKPAKVRIVGGDGSGDKSSKDTKAKGQSRQQKSERRSKKASKKASRSSNGIAREPELLAPTPTPTKADNLANGDDFVSLSVSDAVTDAPAAKPHSKRPPSSMPVEKSKPEKKSKQKQSSPQSTPPVSTPDGKSKTDRFILFIGNLPYAATNDSITNHFIALQPFTVRHSTDKNTGRSKGFAFLEFENYDKMKTCLKLYHHSIFDPDDQATAHGGDDADAAFTKRKKTSKPTKEEDKPKSKNARKINVELTAGGGGNSKQRKGKLDEKNKKLTEERERRYAKEAAEKAKTEHKRKERPATGANADGSEDKGDQRGNVHPSRLKRVEH